MQVVRSSGTHRCWHGRRVRGPAQSMDNGKAAGSIRDRLHFVHSETPGAGARAPPTAVGTVAGSAVRRRAWTTVTRRGVSAIGYLSYTPKIPALPVERT